MASCNFTVRFFRELDKRATFVEDIEVSKILSNLILLQAKLATFVNKMLSKANKKLTNKMSK